jgi:hypothetical protein
LERPQAVKTSGHGAAGQPRRFSSLPASRRIIGALFLFGAPCLPGCEQADRRDIHQRATGEGRNNFLPFESFYLDSSHLDVQ